MCCQILPEASQEDPECADPEHVRHFRFILDGSKSDVCHAQTRQELVTLVPKEWQSSSFYMVHNGITLSSHSTVQGLNLQANQVGDVHLKRMPGGRKECENRELPVTHQHTQVSQRAIDITKRDFTAAAGDSSSVPKQRFPELLELHLARKPTPQEVALLTLRFGETGLQLDNWLQWLQLDKPVVAPPSADPDQAAASDAADLSSNLCRGNVCAGQPTQRDSLTSSRETTACDDQPDVTEPHIIANVKALDADGDGECRLPHCCCRFGSAAFMLLLSQWCCHTGAALSLLLSHCCCVSVLLSNCCCSLTTAVTLLLSFRCCCHAGDTVIPLLAPKGGVCV